MKKSLLKAVRFKPLAIVLLLNLSLLAVSTKAQDGKNDESFNTPDNMAPQGTNGSVSISVIQPDNKIIISGNFSNYNGGVANKLVRLNMDGKIDKGFNAGLGPDGTVNTIALQYNNKILIGGNFSSYNGINSNKLARLNANGSMDKTFKVGEGGDNSITKILIQPDEKILVAGNFTTYNQVTANGLVRLNKNGSIDNTFNAGITDSISKIHELAILPDGKIIISGSARNFSGGMATSIETIRLNKNGSRDYSFGECKIDFGDSYPYVKSIGVEKDGNVLLALMNRDLGLPFPYNGMLLRVDGKGVILEKKGSFWINSMTIQNDDKIMALGFDNPEWGIIKRKVVRMNKDLTVDSTFKLNDDKEYADPNECAVQSLSVQLDGKLIVVGNFGEINGLIANNIARLNTDGSADVTFNQRRGCNGTVLVSAVQPNGRLLIGGEFSRYNYQPVSNIARLKKNGELDPSFYVGSGTNGKVYAIAVQEDGKVVIGGKFTAYNGNGCQNIARLNTDGSFDQTFKNVKADDVVRKITIGADDKLLIGGDFKNVCGDRHVAIARMDNNGTLDAAFQPFIDDIGCVYDCKIAANGKIYLALNYKNTFEWWIDSKIQRLNSDGTEDLSFQIPTALLSKINAIELTRDNKLLAVGMGYYAEPWFYPPSGIVVKLNEDGSKDSTFNYKLLQDDLNKEVRTISLISANKLVIGGDFDWGKPYMKHLALLQEDGSVNTNFAGNTNAAVYSATSTSEHKLVIGGAFSQYSTFTRNGIARIGFDATPSLRTMEPETEQEVLKKEMTMIAYPNPATSTITFDNLKANGQVKIYNASGIEVYTNAACDERLTIELSTYPNGIYFVISEKEGKRMYTKFVISK